MPYQNNSYSIPYLYNRRDNRLDTHEDKRSLGYIVNRF